MASHGMTATYYLELASMIIQDYQGAVEPILKLLAGITDPRGDPRIAALRKEVLRRFYCASEDCEGHFRNFIGDADEVSQTSSSTS